MGKENLIGSIFNRLTLIREVEKRNSERYFLCRCICGNEKEYRLINIRNNHTQSCGCLQKERAIKASVKHNEANKSAEYKVWCGIKRRCYNKKEKNYKHYGARGVKISQYWLNSYETFLSDMGRKPSPKHSIERIDVNGDYCKENCKWVTIKEQQNNRRNNVHFILNGERLTKSQVADELNLSYSFVANRIKRKGFDLEELRKKKNPNIVKYEKDGVSLNLRQWAEKLGIQYKTLYARVKIRKTPFIEAINM